MPGDVASQAATAMRWRALQLAGVEFVYFLRLIILARLLAPEAFGLLAIATIAISLFMTVSDVGMIPALVQRKDATPAQHDGAWTVGLMRGATVALAAFLAAPIIARLFGEPSATPIIQALALRPLLEAAVSIGVAQLTRELKFRNLAFIYLPGAVVDLLTAVLTAPTIGVWALVAGALAGSSTTLLMSYLLAPHRPRLMFQWGEIAPLVNYGRWVLVTGIVGLAGTMLTQLAVSRQLGAAALGLYFLAMRVAFLPINAVDAVVRAVAFPMFVRLRDDSQGSSTAFSGLLGGLALLLVPVYCLVIVLAPAMQEVLGSTWRGTAPIMQVMSLTGVASIVGTLMMPFLMARGQADRAFWLELVQTITLLVALLPAVWLLQVPGAALAVLLGNLAVALVALAWLRRLVPDAVHGAGARILAALMAGFCAATIAWAVAEVIDGLAGLFMAGSTGVAATLLVLWLLNGRWNLRLGELAGILMRRSAT